MNPAPVLDDFQHEVVDFLNVTGGRAIYADPMGARKTGTTLSWIAQSPTATLTIIVAPGAVHGHWAREAARFVPGATVHIGRGSQKQRHDAWDKAKHDAIPAFGRSLYITTYASMWRDIVWLGAQADCVVFDEGHRLKGRRTNVALAANQLAKARSCILATGTPLLNHPHELWQYMHMLRPQEYTSFWKWANLHFFVELKQFKGQRQPTRIIHGYREGHEDIVRNDLLGMLIQRELHEMFDVDEHPWIVEPDHVEVPVTLTPAERKLYDKLVKDLWGKTPSGVLINAGNKLVVGTRLRQLASDWCNLDATLASGSKIKTAVELVSDLARREPVIVFAEFKPTVHRLVDELTAAKLRAVAWTGDENEAAKEAILAAYADGKVDVIVGTIASLGEGVDGLQYRSSQVVMLDRDWVALINDQAIGRARRSGQSKRVTVYHIFALDTIDVSVHEANVRKINFSLTLKGKKAVDVLYGRNLNQVDEIELEDEA